MLTFIAFGAVHYIDSFIMKVEDNNILLNFNNAPIYKNVVFFNLHHHVQEGISHNLRAYNAILRQKPFTPVFCSLCYKYSLYKKKKKKNSFPQIY